MKEIGSATKTWHDWPCEVTGFEWPATGDQDLVVAVQSGRDRHVRKPEVGNACFELRPRIAVDVLVERQDVRSQRFERGQESSLDRILAALMTKVPADESHVEAAATNQWFWQLECLWPEHVATTRARPPLTADFLACIDQVVPATLPQLEHAELDQALLERLGRHAKLGLRILAVVDFFRTVRRLPQLLQRTRQQSAASVRQAWAPPRSQKPRACAPRVPG